MENLFVTLDSNIYCWTENGIVFFYAHLLLRHFQNEK